MNLYESLRTAMAGLTTNKMRAALTMLGIIIGVGAVIASGSFLHDGMAVVPCSSTSLGAIATGSSSLFNVFAIFSKAFAISEGLMPDDQRMSRFLEIANLERGLLLGAVALVVTVNSASSSNTQGSRLLKNSIEFGRRSPSQSVSGSPITSSKP